MTAFPPQGSGGGSVSGDITVDSVTTPRINSSGGTLILNGIGASPIDFWENGGRFCYWDALQGILNSSMGLGWTSTTNASGAPDIFLSRAAANVLQVGTARNTGDGSIRAAQIGGQDSSADPSDPANGEYVIWQSDGTGSGDDGDLMLKITDSGGTTKTITLVDFSAS